MRVVGELGWWILSEYMVELLNEDLVHNGAKGVGDVILLKRILYGMVIDEVGE